MDTIGLHLGAKSLGSLCVQNKHSGVSVQAETHGVISVCCGLSGLRSSGEEITRLGRFRNIPLKIRHVLYTRPILACALSALLGFKKKSLKALGLLDRLCVLSEDSV